MEARFLAGIIQTDTYQRLQVAEEILEYFKDDEHVPHEFPELDRMIGGLGAWMSSSNSKISVSAMEILCVLVQQMKDGFKPYIPTIFAPLKERLGDGKDQVREQAQLLIQQIMRDTVGTPQVFLDRLLETCLGHKNWRVKEQGLVCLTRTLNYFGSGQVTVSRFMGPICNLLGDANSQVRSCAVDTVIEIYRHVGVKVRIDLSRRNLPASRMSLLTAKFDEVDAATNSTPFYTTDGGDAEEDKESVSSCSSNTSARTFGSSRSQSRNSTRPPSVPRGTSGGMEESDFEKAFQDLPHLSIFTSHDLERTVANIDATLGDPKKDWEARVTALKELRAVAKVESLDHHHFLQLLKGIEVPFMTSLKDLRSQVTREACITLSCLSVMLGSDLGNFAGQMMPQLINLLPNSARVMASSAEVCIKYIIKHTATHRLLQPLAFGLSSKSPVTRRQCAQFVSLSLTLWDVHVLERATQLLEDMLRKGISDADSVTRKHMRRVYWGYHSHFPSAAQKLFDSVDPQIQKLLNDEKSDRGMGNGGSAALARPASSLKPLPAKKKTLPPPLLTTASEPVSHTEVFPVRDASQMQRALTSIANVQPSAGGAHITSLSGNPLSPTQSMPPSVRLIRPTVKSPRLRHRTDPMRSLSSLDNTGPPSPSLRPSSRSGSRTGMRPHSRTGLSKRDSAGNPPSARRVSSGGRLSRSAQPSPSVSRESSPTGKSSLPRKLGSLTTEAMKSLYGAGGSHDDDDDAGSVTSERSTFSFTSEISVSPYTKFPNPITDLNELVAMCCSQQWSERRDGISQLHMLLEGPRPFTHAEMMKVKGVFRRMFVEPHIKVFGIFLDTLSHYMEEHKEYLDDWIFLMLLRLLHRQGMDMLSSVHYKLALVLELIRKSFEADHQFQQLCRIVTDQTQPMNNKVKTAWLEYFLELLPMLDSAEFSDTTETRQALTKLLLFTSEPKSAEIRRQSQKVVIGLFELNPATLTLMLRSVAKPLQESANRILRGHVQELSSSGDEAEAPPTSPAPTGRKTPLKRRGRLPAPSPVASPTSSPSRSLKLRPKTPQGARASQSLTPSSTKGLRGSRTISSSTPDMREPGTREPGTPGAMRSRIPTPSRPSYPRRPGSVTPGSRTPVQQKRPLPPRSASVDPEKFVRQQSAGKLHRPTSARSLYTPSYYQNGSQDSSNPNDISPSSSLERFSFSDLPHLDFGSPDEMEDEVEVVKDHTALVLRELQTASSSKPRYMALQSLYTLAREHPERCNWEEHFKSTLLKLIDTMSDEDPGVRMVSLRVLREILKTQHDRLRDFAELTTLKVLKAFADSDASVSQAAEDLFTLLAPSIPSESGVELLAPMALKEKHPTLLGIIKLLTKVVTLAEVSYLEAKLKDLIPGVLRGYSHSESSVRKASVFCLVSIHSVVGEKIREHLTKLTSSQTKLLDLYIKRHQQAAQKTRLNNGPKQ